MKVKTFSFPEDPIERESWIKSLPNVLTFQVSKNIGAVPPSIFGTTKCTLFVQSSFSPGVAVAAKTRRLNTEARKIEADKIKILT